MGQSNVDMGKIPKPSRARFVVAFWLCSMAAVLYLDRVCWAKAAPFIEREYELSSTKMAMLAMAFQIAYGIFEIPTGRWGEVVGARRILTRITLWWSASLRSLRWRMGLRPFWCFGFCLELERRVRIQTPPVC